MSNIYIVPHGIKTSPSIVGIGFSEALSHSCYGPCKREGYTIHFNTKGKGYFNGCPVNEGQGFLVPDGMYAHHFADKNDPWALLWVTFHKNDPRSQEILKDYNADPVSGVFNFTSPIHIRETIKTICNHKSISMNSFELLKLYLTIHCNCISSFSVSQKNTSEIYVNYAVKYIKENMQRPITVNELTVRIGITQPYLYRLFMENFGISPKQYILNVKLDAAKKLLTSTKLSITEIANSVGYTDILTFSRLFSAKEQLSPTKYRQNYSVIQ